MIRLLNLLLEKYELLKMLWKVNVEQLKFDDTISSNSIYMDNSNNIEIVQDDIQYKYKNGILNIKRKIRTNSEDYDKTLRTIADTMLDLAKEETEQQKQVREIKESMYIYKGSDIKTESDKVTMIDKRIDMYRNLQEKSQERQLLRQIRKAFNDNNDILHKQLLEEWKLKYGKSKRT